MGRIRWSALAATVVVVATAVTALVVVALHLRPVPESGSGAARPLVSDEGYAVWARRPDGTPVRWDPCGTLRWVLNPRDAPEDAEALVAAAFARVATETGLEVVYGGTTDEAPAVDRPLHQPRRYGDVWAPVLVAWVPPHTAGLPLLHDDRGVAIPVAVDGVFVSGQVVLNSQVDLASDFRDRAASWGATLLHEVGHLVGLDHVENPAELMYRYPGRGRVEFGPGDRAGLAAVGASEVCLDAGPPRDVTVTLSPRRSAR